MALDRLATMASENKARCRRMHIMNRPNFREEGRTMRGRLITGFSVIWLLCTGEAEIQGQDQAWSPYRASRRSSYAPLLGPGS